MNKLKQTANRLYKFRSLFAQLVLRDIKLKYRRSYLGYLWSILNPLLMMLVLVAVFSQLFTRDIPHYPAYLISGQILFNYMTEATRDGMTSVIDNAALLKKANIPRYIFTLSKVTSSLITMLLSMIALIIVFIFNGVEFHPTMLLFFVPIIQLYFFSLGLGLFLAQAVVFFRDIQYIYSVLTTAWMYLTPIFYSIEIVPEWLLPIIKYLNPMYCFIMQFRCIMLEGRLASPLMVCDGILWAFVMLAIGALCFYRSKNKFILYI